MAFWALMKLPRCLQHNVGSRQNKNRVSLPVEERQAVQCSLTFNPGEWQAGDSLHPVHLKAASESSSACSRPSRRSATPDRKAPS